MEELGKITTECDELSDTATTLVKKPKGRDMAAQTMQIKIQQTTGLQTQAFGKSYHLCILVQSQEATSL